MNSRTSLTGTVKKLKEVYGFIRGTDGVEYFFHQSDCSGDAFLGLREGQSVSFTPLPSSKEGKGPRASQVRV